MMFAFAPWLSPRVLGFLALGAAVLAGWLYVSHLRSEVDRLTLEKAQLVADLNTAKAASEANLKALDLERKHAQEVRAAMMKQRDDALALRDRASTFKTENHDAAQQDGPLAPVLAHALDSLRKLYAQAYGADGGQAHPSAGSKGHAGMSRAAPAPGI